MTEDIKFEDMQPPKDAYPDLTDGEIKARDKSWNTWQQRFDEECGYSDLGYPSEREL